MNKRLVWPLTLLFLATGTFAEAQQPMKVHKIGLLLGGGLLPSSSNIEAFRQGLRKFGYLEGQNIAIEYRVQEHGDRLADLAAELVRLKVDVIVATSTGPALTAKKATKTIPIVFAEVADPVGSGLVASFARPGGNVTGLTPLTPELGGKRLELLKEVVPKLSRVAVLWHSDGPGQKPQMEGMELAANALRLKLQPLDAREPNDFEALFHAATRGRADAVVALSSPRFTSHRAQIVGLATKKRLPSVYVSSDWVEADGLMSYGANSDDRWRRASYYVDKILKGAKPADLPVEQPTKFEFVINLKAAKQIGLTIPPNVLVRADKVIR
jgi:putative tryptophan/tyrosine transport system substrate-binding protein